MTYVGAGIAEGNKNIGDMIANKMASIQSQYLPDSLRIANALKQNELNFAPQMSAANLAEKQAMPGYYRALTGEANARIPFIGAQTDAEKIGAQLKQLQLDMTKSGQLPITGMGGLGSRFIGGRTYIDPQTGEVKSIPTTASTNYLQRATAASQQLQNILPEIAQGQSPYLGATGTGLQAIDAVRNFIGLGSDQSQNRQNNYFSSEGDLNTATEMMIKAFGLNATNENFKNMRRVIEPRRGETASGYQTRVQREVEKLTDRQSQYQNILQGGYGAGQNQNPASPMRLPQVVPMSGGIPNALPQSPQQQQNLQNMFQGQQMTVGPVSAGEITPEMARAELARRRGKK